MADPNAAFDVVMKDEGLWEWTNDESDSGGETFSGVARAFHPEWEGWAIIDSMKSSALFPNNLTLSNELKVFTRQFYKVEFWDKFFGDRIPDQSVANELFDQAVNLGIGFAIKTLQTVLTIFNRGYLPNPLYPDLEIDGKFGSTTLSALVKYLEYDDARELVETMNDRQSYGYQERALINRTKRKYIRGWLKRTRVK